MANSTSSSNVTTNGLGLPGILTIIFVLAKLGGYIDWSWWWVFAPVWISFAILGVILLLVFIGGMIIAALE